MSLRSKQRIVVAALLVLAIWPLVHRGLVVRYGISPWRLFGWAMYCTPKLPVRVGVYAVRGDGRTALSAADDRALRKASRRFSKRRGLWGTLVEPDALAAVAFAARPDTDAIEIEVDHLFLDPRSAAIASQRFTYTCSRARALRGRMEIRQGRRRRRRLRHVPR